MSLNKYCQVCKGIVTLENYSETTACPECGTILAKQVKASDTTVKLPEIKDDAKLFNKYCMVCKKLVSLTVFGDSTPCPECGSILAKQSKSTDSGSASSNVGAKHGHQQVPEQLFKSSGIKDKVQTYKTIAKVLVVFIALASITYRIAQTPSMLENTGVSNSPYKLANTEYIDLIEFNCAFEKNKTASIADEYEKIAVFSGEIALINGFKDMTRIYVEILNKSGEVLDKKDVILQRGGKFKITILPDLPTRRHAETCHIAAFKSWNNDEIKFTSSNNTDSEMLML